VSDLRTISPDELPELSEIPADLRAVVFSPNGPLQAVPHDRLLSKLIATDLCKATRAALDDDLAHAAHSVALVFNDPAVTANGWYRKLGMPGAGSWQQFEELARNSRFLAEAAAAAAQAAASSMAQVLEQVIEAGAAQVDAVTAAGAVQVALATEQANAAAESAASISLAAIAPQAADLPSAGSIVGNELITILTAAGEPRALSLFDLLSYFNSSPSAPPPPPLVALTLSASTIAENSAEDTLVGAINGAAPGSTLTLVATAGGRFKLSAGNIVAGATPTNFEAAGSHSITIRQTLAEASNSPLDTVQAITVTNVFEAGTLNALSVPSPVRQGTTVNIGGATAGSTITGTMPSGWTLNGPARTITIATGAPIDSQNWSLTETLADSANSPRTTTGSSLVEEIAPPVTPDLWYDFTNADRATLSDGNMVDAWAPEIGSFTATQTGAARPEFFPSATATGGPKGRIRFTSGDFLQIPSGFTFDRRAHTMFFVTRRGANETGRGTFLMSTGAAANIGLYAWDNAQLFFWLGSTGQATGLGVGMGASCQYLIAEAADVKAGSDNKVFSRGTPLSTGTFGGARIGLWTGTSFPYTGDMQAVLLFQRALSAAEIAQLQNWANTRFRAPAADNDTVVIFDGDSIDEGIQLQNPQLTPHATDFSWPAQWQLLQGANAPRIVNLGKGGAALSNETAALDVIRELGYNSTYAKRIVMGGYGHNDIQGFRTAAQLKANIDTWIANLRAADPGVVVGYRTILESPTFTAGEEAIRVEVNNYIKGGVVDLDFFDDLAALPGLAGSAGKVDDVHPSSAGSGIMAAGATNLSAQV